jgi:hypothetical protein
MASGPDRLHPGPAARGRAVVEDAQHDLLSRAHPPAVVGEQDAVALARDYPQLVAGLGLDHGAMGCTV